MTFTAKRDPVCGIRIKDDKFTVEHEGKKYSFCSHECLNRFSHGPKKYLIRSESKKDNTDDFYESQPVDLS